VSLTSFLYRVGRGTARRRWLTVGVWAVVAVGLITAGRLVGTAFIDDFRIPGAEAQAATDELKARFPEVAGVTATVVFRAKDGTLEDPAKLAAVRSALVAVALQPHVVAVDDPT